jgi:hypothetical protein
LNIIAGLVRAVIGFKVLTPGHGTVSHSRIWSPGHHVAPMYNFWWVKLPVVATACSETLDKTKDRQWRRFCCICNAQDGTRACPLICTLLFSLKWMQPDMLLRCTSMIWTLYIGIWSQGMCW